MPMFAPVFLPYSPAMSTPAGAIGGLLGFILCGLYWAILRLRGRFCERWGHRHGMLRGCCGYCGYSSSLYPKKRRTKATKWLPHRWWCQL
jgi:hypothetical protein